MNEIPEPHRGGTFFYCPWRERRALEPLGTVQTVTCGILKPMCRPGTRFRTEKAYRRHWRLFHEETAQASTPQDMGLLCYADEAARFLREAGPGDPAPLAADEQENADLLARVNLRVRERFGREN